MNSDKERSILPGSVCFCRPPPPPPPPAPPSRLVDRSPEGLSARFSEAVAESATEAVNGRPVFDVAVKDAEQGLVESWRGLGRLVGSVSDVFTGVLSVGKFVTLCQMCG